MQDTIRLKVLDGNDSLKQVRDTSNQLKRESDTVKYIPQIRKYTEQSVIVTDTISVCKKGTIADITFYDSTNFIMSLDKSNTDNFPFLFTENNRKLLNIKREIIVKTLKDGYEIPSKPFQSDWIVPLTIFALLMFAVVKTFPGGSFRNMVRFLLMRGINENSSRDTGVLFQWQSTLLNFASFISISLFGYLMMKYYGISLDGINGILSWFIAFGIMVFSITARHFICNLTGNFSGQPEIFREYLNGIYHIYRAAGIIFMILALLVLYTTFLPAKVYFTTAFAVAGMLYLLRIARLLLIFMTRHVSIFYLILYLCALEILPVVIIVKYVTGLV